MNDNNLQTSLTDIRVLLAAVPITSDDRTAQIQAINPNAILHFPILEIENIPRAFNPHAYNMLSAQEEKIRNRAIGTEQSIDLIESQKYLSFDAVLRMFTKQLEIIRTLLNQNQSANGKLDEQGARLFNKALESELTLLAEKILREFADHIESKEFIYEDGVEVFLTESKENELKQKCRENLENVFRNKENIIKITTETNLDDLIIELESKINTKESLRLRVDSQITELQNAFFKLQKEAHKVIKIREKFFALKADDLCTASELGDLHVLNNCISNIGFFQSTYNVVNAKNSLGFAPVHIASFHNQPEVLRVLLANKGDVTLRDIWRYKPLHWAAKRGLIPIAQMLLDQNANVNAKGAYGRTPLHMSVFNSHEAMAVFLLLKGANINAQTDREDQKKTPFHDAVIHQDLKMVNCLLTYDQLDVNICDEKGNSPLRHAVFDGNIEIATMIIEHKSWRVCNNPEDPNHLDKLLEINPIKNQNEMKRFLQSLRKSNFG